MTMRALYVSHTSQISGGELSLIDLLEALPPRVQATVAAPEGPLTQRLEQIGVEVLPIRGTEGSLRLHPTRTPQALVEMALAAKQVRRVAASVRADLVHANSIRAGLIVTGLDNAGRRPTVVHVRDCLPGGAVSNATLRAIGRADAIVANSEHTRSTLGQAAGKAHVVHNAVDVSRFAQVGLSAAQARDRLGLAQDGPVLAVIAQITPWKGQDDAIRIVGKLIRDHPQLQLLLVGSPKFDSAATRYDNRGYFESLRQQVAEQELTASVRFLGERDDIAEILRAVDLLLAPSWEEPFGRTIVEAMASGVPVLATEIGGPLEIIGEHDCGLALPPREPGLWAAAIRSLLDDHARLAAMGERGREVARQRFSPDRHAASILAVYETLLSARPHALR